MADCNEKILAETAEKFNISGSFVSCERYGCGHINDTYLLVTENGSQKVRYILQSINTNVFKDVAGVMDNIVRVSAHLKKQTDEPREVMGVIMTKDGKTFYTDGEKRCWRIYEFIENSICLQLPESLDDFYECALAFGRFQRYLADFPADTLSETIPDFHNTPKRYLNFLNALESDKMNRAKNVSGEIEFVKARKDFYSILIDNNKSGKLPLRVSHNDTKSNNVLLDEKTRKALCVIDLDTIMPGFSVTDFGDSIRFGASTASEDEPDLSKVHFDIEKFEIYTKGFLDGCGGLFTDDEIMLLPVGAKMMTIECGMRFLTDYLEGDTYFKISRPDHNLDRCRTQFKLVSEMEEKWDQMMACVEKYTSKAK